MEEFTKDILEGFCTECNKGISLVEDDWEFDLVELVYRSGASETVRMVFHSDCNEARLKQIQEELKKEQEENKDDYGFDGFLTL